MSHSTPSPSTRPHRPARPTGAVEVGVTSPAEPVDPTVPLALWLTPIDPAPAPAGAAQAVPVLLAQNLVAVYTGPTGTVLAVGGSAHLLARTAARLGRRPAPRTAGHRPAAGSVDLLVLTPPTASPTASSAASPAAEGRTPGPDGAAWRRWTRLLSPAGVLAVVLPESRGPSDPAMVVAAAVGAGLIYLQHIPALTWPLHDDHFDPPANVASAHGGEPHHCSAPGQCAEAGAVRTAHLDVLIFGRRTGHTAADRGPSNLTNPVDLDAPDLDAPDLDAPDVDSRTHPAAVPHGATAPEGIR